MAISGGKGRTYGGWNRMVLSTHIAFTRRTSYLHETNYSVSLNLGKLDWIRMIGLKYLRRSTSQLNYQDCDTLLSRHCDKIDTLLEYLFPRSYLHSMLRKIGQSIDFLTGMAFLPVQRGFNNA